MPWKPGNRYNPFTRSLMLAVAMLLLGLLLYAGQFVMSGSRNATCPKHWQPIVRVAKRDIGQFHWLPRHFGVFSAFDRFLPMTHGKVERIDYYQSMQRERPLAGYLVLEWMSLKSKVVSLNRVSSFHALMGTPRIPILPTCFRTLLMVIRFGFAKPE